MTPEEWQVVKQLFARAVQVPPERRSEWLLHECAATPAQVRAELAALLEEDGAASEAFAHPVAAVGLVEEAGEGPDSPAHLPAFIGSYKVESILGHGQCGVVYRAEQDLLRRHVALKVLWSWSPDTTSARRFVRESRALARLRHPGIAQVIETGIAPTPDGRRVPFIAMDLVEGRPITQAAASLPLREKVALMVRVCEAIEHAHQKGVIHRDLKPAHVLVAVKDAPSSSTAPDAAARDDFTPRIIDFGIARLLDSNLPATATGEGFVGTLPYAAPEQFGAEGVGDVDTRADVYALGVLLYELIAGRPPYNVTGHNVLSAIAMVSSTQPVALGLALPEAKGDLEAVVSKAMQKDRRARYQFVGELRADLERYLHGTPVLARNLGELAMLARLARRHLRVSVPVVAFVCSLLIGVIALGVAYRQVVSAHEIAHAAVAALLDEVTNHFTDKVGAGTERAEILSRLHGEIEKFVHLYPNDESIQGDYATILTRLGEIEAERGEFRRAKELFLQAATLRERLVVLSRDRFEAQAELSRAVVRVGDAAGGLGDRGEQSRRYREAFGIQRSLAELQPTNPASLETLAYSWERLAHHAVAAGDTEQAIELISQMDAAANALFAADPDSPANRWLRASTNASKGMIFHKLLRKPEALAAAEATLSDAEWLVAHDTFSRRYRMLLVGALVGVSGPLAGSAREPEADRMSERAITVARELAAADSADAATSEMLRVAIYGRAQVLFAARDRRSVDLARELVDIARGSLPRDDTVLFQNLHLLYSMQREFGEANDAEQLATAMDQLSRQMAANPAANLLCLDVAASWMVERGIPPFDLAELQSVVNRGAAIAGEDNPSWCLLRGHALFLSGNRAEAKRSVDRAFDLVISKGGTPGVVFEQARRMVEGRADPSEHPAGPTRSPNGEQRTR